MAMVYLDFLNAIIDDGQYEVQCVYTKPHQQAKKEGALAGFESCRGKTGDVILRLLEDAQKRTEIARTSTTLCSDVYWRIVMVERQIEWVLNVLSAGLDAQGLPPLTAFTARGLAKAIDILGVRKVA
jgi:hypothetical protein